MDYKTTKSNSTLKLIMVIVFVALAVTITFVIGFGVGRFTQSSNTPATSDRMSTLDAVYNVMINDFYYGEDTEEYRDKLINDAIKGMVDSQGDIHTEYMTPEEVAEFSGALQSSIVGIGIRYTELNGEILVVEVLRDSPAERAGIQEGDFIVAVDGASCKDNGVDYVASLVTGEQGTEVTLTLDRMGKTLDVTATRDVIGTTISSKIVDGVGVLSINSFGDQTAEELRQHVNYLKQNNVKRLVIDLRDNGGGYAATLDAMCRYFMDNDEIIMIEEDRNGRQIVDKVKKSEKTEYEKIVILINGNSASCSEVFTMALKENCGAVTVGTTSYGKGLAQLQKVFRDGSAIKYTDVIWKSGQGVFINGEGIDPDYEVLLDDALYVPYLSVEEGTSYGFDNVNAEISLAQIKLKFLGYNIDRTDGYFSAVTEEAVKQFQSDNALNVSGRLDQETGVAIDAKVLYEWKINRSVHDVQMQKAMELVKQ